MKILIINNFFTKYAGAEKIMLSEAELLENNGHEVIFFANNKQPYFYEGYKYSNFFPEYIDYNNLATLDRIKHLQKILYNVESEQKLDKLIKKVSPDVVHCHNIFYHLTPSVLLACYKSKIPVVMTLHDARIVCPAGTLRFKDKLYCYNELCINGNGFHCLINRCKENSFSKSLVVYLEYLTRKANKINEKVTYFISPSLALKDLVVKSGIESNKIKLIPNFINLTAKQDVANITYDSYFFYAGRLAKYKGVYELLKAFEKIDSFFLYIAGTGEEEENIKKIIEMKKLKNVKLLGYLDNKELMKYYKSCYALLLPSYWFENCPLSLIEAYSNSKPVIGSNLGGISELIDDQETGLLFDPENFDDLLIKIQQMISNPELVHIMGTKARKKVESIYNSNVHYNKLMEIYQLAIKSFES